MEDKRYDQVDTENTETKRVCVAMEVAGFESMTDCGPTVVDHQLQE